MFTVEIAIKRCVVAVQNFGDLTYGFAFVDQTPCQRDLVCAQLRWPTELHVPFFGGLSTARSSLADQLALEFSDAGEHGQNQSPSG